MKNILLCALVAAIPAFADSYVFGYSGGGNVTRLVLDGSTIVMSSDRGWYDVAGNHFPTNDNYIVGETGGNYYNDWFMFTITGDALFTSAVLELDAASIVGGPHNYRLFDFTGSVSDLVGGTGGVAAYADLGSGIGYGSLAGITSGMSNTVLSISLNAAAMAKLNASAGRPFVIGGTLESGDDPEVPEPSTLALAGAGLVAAGLLRRKKS